MTTPRLFVAAILLLATFGMTGLYSAQERQNGWHRNHGLYGS